MAESRAAINDKYARSCTPGHGAGAIGPDALLVRTYSARLLLPMQQRQKLRALAGGRDHRMTSGTHTQFLVILIQRFGNDHDAAFRFPVIERVGPIVHRVAERIEIPSVRERRG